MSASTTDTRTATQRIEDLEKVVTMLYQATQKYSAMLEQSLPQLQQDSALVKDALKLLNKKTEAIVVLAASPEGISIETVSNLVVKMNVSELVNQTADWVKNGSLVAAEEANDDSFVVAQESNAEGAVVNPRIQFRLDSIDAPTREAFKGKKVGDTISFGEGKFDAKILELYSISAPKSAEAPATASAAPEAPAEAAAETAPAEAASEAQASAPAADTAPTESPVAFGLEFHGQPEASLTPATTQTA